MSLDLEEKKHESKYIYVNWDDFGMLILQMA